MVKNKIGLGSVGKSTSSNNQLKNKLFSARVTRVILNENDYPDLFEKFGGWSGIGMVFFNDIDLPEGQFNENQHAFPLFPNIKNFPLENEIIYILSLPSPDIYDNSTEVRYYYISPINIWNNINHNSIPNNILKIETPSESKTPEDIINGSNKILPSSVPDLRFGNYFQEKNNIRSLKPYEGDIIYEGRWGQSIRFGSTQNNLNPWSSNNTNNGNPITIIKNGQKINLSGNKWEYINEDINGDLSSIYMTSNQIINIDVSSKNYNSYKENPPQNPEKYNLPQIILNSDRILINSKNDHILLSSKKSINLNSSEGLNVDSKKPTILNSPKIYLGSKDASEPLILGNKFKDLMTNILNELINVSNQLSVLTSLPAGTPYANLNLEAGKANLKLNLYKNQLSQLLSKRNYTL